MLKANLTTILFDYSKLNIGKNKCKILEKKTHKNFEFKQLEIPG